MLSKNLVLMLCAFVLLEVNESKYLINTKFKDYNKYCDSDYYPWLLTKYKYIGIAPLHENNTECLQAITKNCASSDLVNFSRGVLELNVFLRLFSIESGLTVTVLNENDVPVIDYVINRFEGNYTDGWNKIFLDLDTEFFGYIHLRGHIERREMIVVDYLYHTKSLYHNEIPNTLFKNDSPVQKVKINLEMFKLHKRKYDIKLLDFATEIKRFDAKSRLKRSIDEFDGLRDQTMDSKSDELKKSIEISNTQLRQESQTNAASTVSTAPSPTWATGTNMDPMMTASLSHTSALETTVNPITMPAPSPNVNLDPGTTAIRSSASAPDTPADLEQPGTTIAPSLTSDSNTTESNQTKDPTPSTDSDTATNTTENPDFNSTDTTNAPNTQPTTNTDSTTQQPQQNNFWTPLTITLVAVGSFVVLGITAVSSYYCGKVRSTDDLNFMTEEEIPPQPIIPRVKNVNRFGVSG